MISGVFTSGVAPEGGEPVSKPSRGSQALDWDAFWRLCEAGAPIRADEISEDVRGPRPGRKAGRRRRPGLVNPAERSPARRKAK